MDSDLHTDEYTISMSREMVVCRNMIGKAEKSLARFEEKYGVTTAELALDNRWDVVPDGASRQWQDEYAGLQAWRQRLCEYEEAYQRMR